MWLDPVISSGNPECWNAGAFTALANAVNEREKRLSRNPDVNVNPGSIACQGCVVNEGGLGIVCTARVVPTQYTVKDETPAMPNDTPACNMAPGFELFKPGSGTMAEGNEALIPTPKPNSTSDKRLPNCKAGFLGQAFGRL